MNGPGLDAPSPARRSRTLVLIAMILIGVPLGTIGWLNSLPEDTGELVNCLGTIRVDGQPLNSGTVTARREDAGDGESNATGTIDALGRFRLTTDGQPGALVGHYRVTVVAGDSAGGIEIPEGEQAMETTTLSIDVQPEARFNIFTLNISIKD